MGFQDQTGREIDWDKVKAAIFDVDGTLYCQRPVRIRMALKMGRFFLLHPRRWREAAGIYYFRKLREQEEYRTQSPEAQAAAAAEKAGIRENGRLDGAIRRWMFQEPLAAVAAHGRQDVLDLLRRLKREGKRIIIYSDYAPEDKLSALGVTADAVYYPGHGGVEELKPSEKSMKLILEKENISASDTVYLGDREEKDGRSAALMGIRYIQVKGGKKE